MTYPLYQPQQNQGWPGGGMPQMAGPIIVTVGDISVTGDMVNTPSGSFPLADVTIYGLDQTHIVKRIPAWAIVATIIAFWFFFLGLLFLLVREEEVSGYVMVTVEAQGRRHICQVPASSAMMTRDIMARINYVQTLATNARARQGRR